MRSALAVAFAGFALATLAPGARGQQVADEGFGFQTSPPAFAAGTGPTVCIDEGHYNFHTATGRYRPFADLLRADGYEVRGWADDLAGGELDACALLVIANPLAAENEEDWSYPHPSAFTKDEIRGLMDWVRSGGRLLLFADHAPIAGAARDLAAVFGVMMTDVYADGGPGPDLFRIEDGTLRPHPVQEGRGPREAVDHVLTFTGQAFQITEGWEPLLVFGPDAVARINLTQAFQEAGIEEWPAFSVAGWAHGAAREWEAGRVLIMGEAAMCSAQLGGPRQTPMGMNVPAADQNALFCLNMVRWLTDVL